MNLALNNLQGLICHKTQETNQPKYARKTSIDLQKENGLTLKMKQEADNLQQNILLVKINRAI